MTWSQSNICKRQSVGKVTLVAATCLGSCNHKRYGRFLAAVDGEGIHGKRSESVKTIPPISRDFDGPRCGAVAHHMTLRQAVKRVAQGIALVLAFPFALLCLFGRAVPVFTTLTHIFALGPGLIGSYLRVGFYKLTLRQFSVDTTMSFGSFFVHPDTSVGSMVSIGSYCVIGRTRIGHRTQIASHVEITSGRHQHARDEDGNLLGSTHGETVIGEHCWIGASAIIMATVGDETTIGAGSVVVKDIPARVVAVGNPARVIRSV